MYSGYKLSYAYSNVDVKVGLAYLIGGFDNRERLDRVRFLPVGLSVRTPVDTRYMDMSGC